jgi:3-phosphoshikimate 1-carboxyvinyltransferase
MTLLTIQPGAALNGSAAVPGDKSISHRAALFAALAQGESRIENFLQSGVTDAMLRCLDGFGVSWDWQDGALLVQGAGLTGWRTPAAPLDCGNSATTLRLVSGAAAAAGLETCLDGSAGLRRRPMERILTPLRRLGVAVDAAAGDCTPLNLHARPAGQNLRAAALTLPVASAQVKSCLLLAALAADGPVTIIEPSLSRDHSERMLRAQGVDVRGQSVQDGWAVTLTPPAQALAPLQMPIPGDFSAAAFLLVAALITPDACVRLPGVELNPTRTGLLEALLEMGADIRIENRRELGGEPVGDLVARASQLRGGQVSGQRVVDMIDEFPIFAVAAAYAQGDTRVSDAQELRYKESDRIHLLCGELAAQGAQVDEAADGFVIHGRGGLPGGAQADPHGDHRLAMSLAVAGLASRQPIAVGNSAIIGESFPGFSAALRQLGARLIEEPALD